MPEVHIEIGGRTFEVACQAGEESFLQSAAAMLNEEAQVLSDQIGRMPEGRMLLMAGLMLADRTAANEDRIKELEGELEALRAQPAPEPERIEVDTNHAQRYAHFTHLNTTGTVAHVGNGSNRIC